MMDRISLTTNLEVLEELITTQTTQIEEQIKSYIETTLCKPHNATLQSVRLNTTFDGLLEAQFNIGFYNEAEQRDDFGSELWGYYNPKKDYLELNHPCIGMYSRNDLYQVARIKLINTIFNNIDSIEGYFKDLFAGAEIVALLKNRAARVQTYAELQELADKERAEKEKQIAESLTAGQRLKYDSDKVSPWNQLFKTAGTDGWIIEKVCEKTLTIYPPTVPHVKKRFNIDSIVALIYNGAIIVKEGYVD